MPRRVPDEYVLLCERCGYEIEGLPAEANCPECGKPVAESLPTTRSGSPWQTDRTKRRLVWTWWSMLRRPRSTFDRVSPETAASDLRSWTISHASIVLGVLWLLGMFTSSRLAWDAEVLLAVLFMYFIVVFSFASFEVLTVIEERGIRFWGPRRGWRITPDIAKVICAHASVGWLVGSVLAVIGHALGWVLSDMTNHGNYGILRGPMQLAPISLPAIALIAGMLHFEVLVYIGMTRMKFANRPRPTPLDASVPPASMPSPPSADP